MQVFRVLCAGLLTAAAGAAAAQNGFVAPDETPWPRWQLRAQWVGTPGLGAAGLWSEASASSGLRLVGDYYLFDMRSAGGEFAGGLRATSALTFARAAAPPGGAGTGLVLPGRSTTWPGSDAAMGALPYVGLGFTGVWPRVGWGFTADIGLAGHGGGGLRLNAPSQDGTAFDDAVRELRLAPVLQLGVTYAF